MRGRHDRGRALAVAGRLAWPPAGQGAYALSFLILGQLWLAHHRIFGVIARVDYVVLRSNLLFLGLIALMPFPVRLLSDYSDRPLAVAIYAVAFIAAYRETPRILREATATTLPADLQASLRNFLRAQRGVPPAED